jgi:hypothetical protein
VISVILYGRNDNYGYNLHKRAALSFNCIAEVLSEDDEILFVDYNTPDDFPTFPEAIQDTLTERARKLLRIFRVRPSIHDRFKSKTRLVALEPIARNVAVRRSRPSNRWILSTNTDMIFILQHVRSLTDLVRDLPKGFYHAPRIELPETLWESLDRQKPREIINTVRDWGWSLHLNEIVFGSETILYDGPGDFQLLMRDDLFQYHGFNEEMLLGWHVDSNIAKRMGLVYGKVGDLGTELYGYHCDHTRQITTAHGHTRTENDWRRFVTELKRPSIPEQANTWGCPRDDIEEIHLTSNPAQLYVKSLQETIGPPLSKPLFAHYTGSTYDSVDYDPGHLMPFLVDLFASSPKGLNVGWYAARAETLRLFVSMWRRLGFGGTILADNSLAEKTDGLLNVVFAARETILAEADVFVFDFGKAGGKEEADKLRVTFAHVIRSERERKKAGRSLRRIICLNAIHNRFEHFVCQRIAVTYSPFAGRMRQGFVLPAFEGEDDWLALLRPGEAGIQDGKFIKTRSDKVGVLALGSKYLEAGWYTLSVKVEGSTEDDQWSNTPCVVIDVRSGNLVIAKYALSGCDLNGMEHKLPFEVSPEIADTLTGIDTYLHILSPVAVTLQKLTVTAAVPTDELKALAQTYSAPPLPSGALLNFDINGAGMIYQGEGWALPENSGTWTDGPRTTLTGRLVGWPPDDIILEVKAHPFLVRDRHPAFAVEVIINGKAVECWTYCYPKDNGWVVRSARIPASLLAGSPMVRMELKIGEPAVPKALGVHPTDDRQLGIFVSSIWFLSERDKLKRAGAVVTPGTFVDFRENGRGTAYQCNGWALAEKAGTWTNGLQASLRAQLVDWSSDDIIVQISAHPFLVRDHHPSVAVKVAVNGVAVERWNYRYPEDNGWVVRSARVPASLLAGSPILQMELEIDEPAVPEALGVHPTDDRQLGLFVSSIWFLSERDKLERAGAVVTPGSFIDFRENGRGAVYEFNGWALAETGGTWTNASRASLRAQLVDWPSDDMIVQISAHPFLIQDRHPSLTVKVTVNGAAVEGWIYRYPEDNGWVVRSARVPASLLAGSPILQIELEIDEPAIPEALGVHPTDDRQLGLFVSSIWFLSERDKLERAGAVVTPGTLIDFREKGRGAAYQFNGWALAENSGTWTNGSRASLTAKLVDWPSDDMIVQISAHPFLVQEHHPSLAVKLAVNGVALERWIYRYPEDKGWVMRSARVPASLLGGSPILRIELEIDQPGVPEALGVHPADDRQLGLLVSSISFAAAGTSTLPIRMGPSLLSMLSAVKRTGAGSWPFRTRGAHR